MEKREQRLDLGVKSPLDGHALDVLKKESQEIPRVYLSDAEV
jgi:hypothetical protein